MAGTAKKTINKTSWTKIADATISGYFENTTRNTILINESVADPGDDSVVGHTYEPNERDVFNATIGLWARVVDSTREDFVKEMIVTEY